MRRRLPEALASAVGALDDGSDALWVIRSIRLELSADLENATDAALVQLIASTLSEAIERHLKRGSQDEVFRFEDEADRVARYVVDRARGSADRWFYSSFDGLRALSVSAAIVEALSATPSVGRLALARWADRPDFADVAARISGPGAARIVEALGDAAEEPPRSVAVEAALAVPAEVETVEHVALHMLARILARRAEACAAPWTIARLVAALRSRTTRAAVLTAVRAPTTADAVAAVRSVDPQLVPEVPAWRALIAEAPELLHSAEESAAQTSPRPREQVATRYGGVFYLLPLLVEWAPLLGDGALRRRTATRLLGDRADFDALVVELLEGTREAWTQTADDVLARIVVHHVGTGRIDGRDLVVERGDVGGRPFVVVRDVASDAFLALADDDEERCVAEAVARTGVTARQVFVGRDWGSDDPVHQRWLREARPAERDVGALREDGSTAAEALLTHALQRAFTRRVLGFAWSSTGYVRDNFLHASALVSRTDAGVEAQITPPPLGMVLQVAGLHRGEVELPWAGLSVAWH
ncbi:MAG: hypothetical protein RIT81_00970 [Deltaproteobacteria bacterium]